MVEISSNAVSTLHQPPTEMSIWLLGYLLWVSSCWVVIKQSPQCVDTHTSIYSKLILLMVPNTDNFHLTPLYNLQSKDWWHSQLVYALNYTVYYSSPKHKSLCNQGCHLSPVIYLLTAEILANKLKGHKGIKGIKIWSIEYLISQFADDTDLYLLYGQETVTNVFHVLAGIEKNTGFHVSYDKTTMYRTGLLANSNAKLWTPRKVNWANDTVNTLGIDLYNSIKDRDCNFDGIINKLRTV